MPKINLQVRIPQRTVLHWSQMAERLVEVPPVSLQSCVFIALVPQMRTELVEVPAVESQSEFQQHCFEQTVDIPDHGGVRRVWEIFKEIFEDRVQQRFVEQILQFS